MNPNPAPLFRIAALAATFILLPSASLHSQGPLTPPGAPAPTMKALDQVEPRIIINATNTPGDANSVFRIAARGSYYLTGNITGVSGKSAIEIAAGDVTIDLNGFTLQGVSGSLDGITAETSGSFDNVTIRDGVVTGFGQDGVDLNGSGGGSGSLIEMVHALDNGGFGIWSSGRSIVRACTASSNGADGIVAGSASTLTGCTSSGNDGKGIYALSLCTISECSVTFNDAEGIATGTSTITGCLVAENGMGIDAGSDSNVSRCTVRNNNNDGIRVFFSATVTDCTVLYNAGDGIETAQGSYVSGNLCRQNGFLTDDGAGIHATQTENRIEDNHVLGSDRGLDVDGANNVIRGNSVRGNTDNYAIVAGNHVEILLSQLPETIDFAAKVIVAGSLTGPSIGNGLTVASDNVTIDLNGHALIGVAGSLDGIAVSGSRANVSVRNGCVRNWGGDGIDSSSVTGGQYSDLELISNGESGLEGGSQVQINRVLARANTSAGITTGTVAHVTDCTSSGNTTVGISVSTGSTVERCVVSTNTGAGLAIGNACTVLGNSCDSHASAAGIRVTGDRNRIDGNNLTRNSIGLEAIAGATGNTIIRNSALGNTTAYSIVAGNDVGPIGPASAATNPFANISF